MGGGFEPVKQDLLDVGCGKGVVLKEAAGFQFRKITGIEVQPEIIRTARRNLKRLGLEEKAGCICADAAEYDGYGDYNVFFFFNPFDGETLNTVMEKIMESRKAGELFIVIYHNPVYLSEAEKYLPGAARKILHDKRKDYDTCILYGCVS